MTFRRSDLERIFDEMARKMEAFQRHIDQIEGAEALRRQGHKGPDTASAATITLPNYGNYFLITGTTNIDYIVTDNWLTGSIIVMRFAGILTLNHKSGSPPANALAMDIWKGAGLTTSVDDVYMFILDTDYWMQID